MAEINISDLDAAAALDGTEVVPADQGVGTVKATTQAIADLANAAAVLKTLYDAHTVLIATADNTPVALPMGASTILARLAAGNIKAATPAELRTLLNVQDGATDDLTAAEILALLLTVDGAGSGLDADTLDAQSSAYFVNADNHIDGTTNHVFTAADDTKLAGVEALADVTDAANVAAAGAFMASNVIDEDSFASNSDTKVPTQQATKAYVDAEVAGASATLRVEDEGGTVVAAASGINFAGDGVVVTDAGSGEALVTIDTITGAEHDSRDHSAAMSGVVLADLSDGDNVKGFADARADINLARPTGYASIEWLAEDEPTNWVDGDSLIVVAA